MNGISVGSHSPFNMKHLLWPLKPCAIDSYLNVSLANCKVCKHSSHFKFHIFPCSWDLGKIQYIFTDWMKHMKKNYKLQSVIQLLLSWDILSQKVKFSFFILEAYRFFTVISLGGFPAELFLPGVILGPSRGTPIVSTMILTECVLPRRASLSTLSVITWASSRVSASSCCSARFLQRVHRQAGRQLEA